MPKADAGPVTVQSGLLAPPRATLKTLERYMLARQHGKLQRRRRSRHPREVHAACKAAGLDPLLVVSQMVLETGNLMSYWSQPPRRNPAGIGVTGQPGAGISFPNWDKAVSAHVGRLLAYALPKDGGTDGQRKLIDEALKVRPLPDDRRGRRRGSRASPERGPRTRSTPTRSPASRTRSGKPADVAAPRF